MSSTIFITLNGIECCNCGCVFGMTAEMDKRLRESRGTFHCPNGHAQHYLAETEADKLKRQVAQLQTNLEHKDARINQLVDQGEALKRSRSAIRGVHTRTCNRIKHGVCPCCTRTFQNLAAHMKTKHPDFVETIPQEKISPP